MLFRSRVEYGERDLTITRETPAHLGIKLIAGGPPSYGQLLILSPQGGNNPELFCQQIDAILAAFEATWPEPKRQVLTCDVTMRDLFESTADHAFKELWETRLGQTPEKLAVFERPVLGGGVRFVMPPSTPKDSYTIELKIESFLQDSRKLFVEIHLIWAQMESPGEPLSGSHRLQCANDYIQRKIIPFISGT